MEKKLVPVLIVVIVFMILLFYINYHNNTLNHAKSGLKINEWSFGLGSVDGVSTDKTKLTYSFKLTNENDKNIFIKSIEPLVNEKIKDKIISPNTVVTINKDIKPNETIQIDGELIFDTKGLSKTDIEKLEPLLKDIKVSTDETISLIQ